MVVEKEGFVAAQKELRSRRINLGGSRVDGPQPHFIQGYERSQSRMRLGAYISTGLTVAGVARSIAFQTQANGIYGAPDQAGTFQYYRSKVVAGMETERDDR